MSWRSPLDRPSLDELFSKYQSELAELRSSLAPDLTSAVERAFADDVWLLRYVLSFNGDALVNAANAARKAIAWRQSNALFIEAARRRTAPPGITDIDLRIIDAYYPVMYQGLTAFGDPILINRASACGLRELMDRVSEDTFERWINYINECAWLHCEEQTRIRRVFVKQLNFQDLQSVSMKQDKRFFRVLGRTSSTNEWLRPQLIGKTFVFNPPRWFTAAKTMAGAFMSKRSMEKVSLHPTCIRGSNGEQGLCPFALVLLGESGAQLLPTFLGGCNECDDLMPASIRNQAEVRDLQVRRAHQIPLALLRLPSVTNSRSHVFSDASDDFVDVEEQSQFYDAMSDLPSRPVSRINFSIEKASSWGQHTDRWCCQRCCLRRRLFGQRQIPTHPPPDPLLSA